MPFYRFGKNDIFDNVIKTHPKCAFAVYAGRIFYNNAYIQSGSFIGSVTAPEGTVSLFEQNIDRELLSTEITKPGFFAAGVQGSEATAHQLGASSEYSRLNKADAGPDFIVPFMVKDGFMSTFKTVTTGSFNKALPGDIIVGPTKITASIAREYHQAWTGDAGNNRFTVDLVNPTKHPQLADQDTYLSVSSSHVDALKNTFNFYTPHSSHYAYSASNLVWNHGLDKGNQEINLISIPSIFFGSSIKKGSVHLKWYVSGALMAECHDREKNGELIQVSGSGSPTGYDSTTGSVAGMILYNEGFFALTGAWSLNDDYTDKFRHAAGTPKSAESPKWTYFGVGANDSSGSVVSTTSHNVSSSFVIEFEGTQYVPVKTMFTHAPKGELNFSNNPTFVSGVLDSDYKLSIGTARPHLTSSIQFKEDNTTKAKNVVSSSFKNHTGSFEKTTYISQIGIYDNDKNLIGIAKLANPVKKTETRELSFKLKLDI